VSAGPSAAEPMVSAVAEEPSDNVRELVIEASSGWRALDLSEVWLYRELLYFLVWRDLKVRFKQTVLGVAWIVLRPLLSMVIFTVVFGRFARIPSDGLPYPIFVLAAMLPWNFFASAVTSGTQSLVGNAHLISKVYFPRLVIPLAAIVSSFVEIGVSLVLLLSLMVFYGRIPPASALVTVPLLLLLVLAVSFGASLWLGSLNVKYRDVGNAIPFFVQVLMYATPIVYPLSIVPEKYRWVVALNPMTGIVEGFRSALFGRPWAAGPLAAAAALGFAGLATGLFFFRSSERTFADTV
jgi:lipopolysaccharide transport system permease protein